MEDFIGNRISELRRQRGFSLRELAKLARVSQGNLSMIESGDRHGGNLTLLSGRRLAKALGVSLDYLVGMYEEHAQEEQDTDTAPPAERTERTPRPDTVYK
jgi:XRE family transcriptional regulator, master regulator for biofilm formation